MQELNTYNVASASRRIFSKFLDYVLIISVSILINFLILYLSLNSNNINSGNYNYVLFSGLFLLSMVINLIIWFFYFILIPGMCSGRTLFSLLLRIKLYWDDNQYLMSRLIKHEGIWILPIYFLNIIIALVSFAFDQPAKFITNIFSFMNNSINQSMQIACSILFVVMMILSLFILGNIVNIIANNNRSSYLDDVCEIYVIHTLKIENKKDSKKETKHLLPGSIDEKELDNL